MLPATTMYVYLGATAESVAAIVAGRIEGTVGQKILFGAGLLATIAVMVIITRIAKRAIREAVPTDAPPETLTVPSAAE